MRTYCVVFRTGGRENFQWKRSIAANREETAVRLAEVQKMGYQAFMEDYDKSVSIGLPETYSVADPVCG